MAVVVDDVAEVQRGKILSLLSSIPHLTDVIIFSAASTSITVQSPTPSSAPASILTPVTIKSPILLSAPRDTSSPLPSPALATLVTSTSSRKILKPRKASSPVLDAESPLVQSKAEGKRKEVENLVVREVIAEKAIVPIVVDEVAEGERGKILSLLSSRPHLTDVIIFSVVPTSNIVQQVAQLPASSPIIDSASSTALPDPVTTDSTLALPPLHDALPKRRQGPRTDPTPPKDWRATRLSRRTVRSACSRRLISKQARACEFEFVRKWREEASVVVIGMELDEDFDNAAVHCTELEPTLAPSQLTHDFNSPSSSYPIPAINYDLSPPIASPIHSAAIPAYFEPEQSMDCSDAPIPDIVSDYYPSTPFTIYSPEPAMPLAMESFVATSMDAEIEMGMESTGGMDYSTATPMINIRAAAISLPAAVVSTPVVNPSKSRSKTPVAPTPASAPVASSSSASRLSPVASSSRLAPAASTSRTPSTATASASRAPPTASTSGSTPVASTSTSRTPPAASTSRLSPAASTPPQVLKTLKTRRSGCTRDPDYKIARAQQAGPSSPIIPLAKPRNRFTEIPDEPMSDSVPSSSTLASSTASSSTSTPIVAISDKGKGREEVAAPEKPRVIRVRPFSRFKYSLCLTFC